MAWQRICCSDELAEGECLEFSLSCGDRPWECFLLRHGGHYYAYRNACPHTGAPLNWMPNIFLNFEGDLIQCAIHGALFRIEDGGCLHGPCNGRPLTLLELRLEGADVWVQQPMCAA